MTNQQAPEALADPSPDQLRAIARTARNSSGSASDDCGPLAYVLHGWRAAAIAFRAQQAALVEAQQPAPSAVAASKAVLAAIRAANMQLVRTGDDEFMLVTLKQATPQADSQPAAAGATPYPMAGDEDESDLGNWQDGATKPTMDGTYLREFDEGLGTSEFCEGKWLRDGFFPSDIQDARWRGRSAPQPSPTAQEAESRTAVARCTNSDTWNCKYCRKTETCDALQGRAATPTAQPAPAATPQADSQPAPEYVGNGMFKGETIQKAAEHWANWCDVRCMTGLSEFLRVVAARAPADSVTAPAGGGAVVEWHTPGLGEVHNESHGQLIFCTDGDDVADDTLARRVCAALNATPPIHAADSVLEDADPLQGAANWLAEAHGQFCVAVLQGCLMIGYNRAKRLHDAAIAARKQGANHD